MAYSRLPGLLIVACVAIIVATVGAGAMAMTTEANVETPTAEAAIDDPGAQVDPPDENGTDVPHERPDSVARSGPSAALAERLSGRLTDRLTESAVRIGDGEYETAQRLVGDRYDEDLALYMDVYRTAVTSDLQAVEDRRELFADTAALQIEYAQTLSEHREVRTAYENAREADERDRARERARELNGLARELRQIDDSLAVRYRTLGTTTAGTFETASASIADTTDETSRQTEDIVQREYTGTEVTAQADPSGSFADPILVTGVLTAPTGVAPSGNVSFLVNGRTQFTSVGADGSFTIRYRPVTEPVGPTSIDVAYAPDDSALYLGSATEVTTTIAQDSPTVSIRNATDAARAASPVTASGRVTVDDVPVSNTSVALYVGDRRLAETRTNDGGEYRVEAPLPADVSTGTQTLSIRAGAEDTAVGPAEDETEITVEQTETRLSLAADRSERSVRVTGRLLAGAETGVSGRTVSVSLDGDRRQTVRTDADGNYEAVVELPQSVNESDSVPVRVEFNGSGTNLGSSSVAALLRPPGQGPLPDGAVSRNAAVAVGLALVLGGGYGLYRRRDPRGDKDDPDGSSEPGSIAPESASPFVSPTVGRTGRADPLAPVRDHLERGDARTALLTLYATVRAEFETDGASSGTHWEFFESTAGRFSDDQRSTLRGLTEAFEAVRFGGGDPDPEHVRALMTETKRLLTDRSNGGSDTDHTEEFDE